MNFLDLNIIKEIIDALSSIDISSPTPIQTKVIPYILKKQNVLAKAATGTGKTAAFVVPILQMLKEEGIKQNSHPKVLVLSPNRELSNQIQNNFVNIGKNLPYKTVTIIGGINYGKQINMLRNGADIVVATPGRCKDLINQQKLILDEIKYFVLDEADLILDMGFINDIKFIRNKIGGKFQSVLLSATIPANIKNLAKFICNDYEIVESEKNELNEGKINEKLFIIENNNKKLFLLDLINKNPDKSFIVFCNMKRRTDDLTRFLKESRVKTRSIHGDKTQSSRQETIELFKNNKIQLLIATDIAARGIHIDNVNFVIHFDVPKNYETYVHRTGRTGRAGKDGESLLLSTLQEGLYTKNIIRNSKNLKHETDQKWSIPIELSEFMKSRQSSSSHNSNRSSGGYNSNRRSSGGGSQYSNNYFNRDNKFKNNNNNYYKKNSGDDSPYDSNKSRNGSSSYEGSYKKNSNSYNKGDGNKRSYSNFSNNKSKFKNKSFKKF